MKNFTVALAAVGCALLPACGEEAQPTGTSTSTSPLTISRATHHAPNHTGWSETYTTGDPASLHRADNEFFDDLGTNGRTCETCHRVGEGMTITPEQIQARFEATGGLDPLFRPVDGSNSPTADVATVEARRAAYSLLLQRGVIRVGMTVPSGAEFELIAVDDPYGHASAAELSLFRRPLPAANLAFTLTIMWDGRETGAGQTLSQNLASQAAGATRGHAQGAVPLTAATLDSIVNFELALFDAQGFDLSARELHAGGGRGGSKFLAEEPFNPAGNVRGFDLYDAWAGAWGGEVEDARASVARGQALFAAPRGGGRCTICHDTHNIGTHSRGNMFDIGVSAPTRRPPELPLYTLRNISSGEVKQTTDPGKALVTGRWSDVDRFKSPNLRGVAARAPYFHDGSAQTLDEVLDFYEARFNFVLTPTEQADLVAFLRAL